MEKLELWVENLGLPHPQCGALLLCSTDYNVASQTGLMSLTLYVYIHVFGHVVSQQWVRDCQEMCSMPFSV